MRCLQRIAGGIHRILLPASHLTDVEDPFRLQVQFMNLIRLKSLFRKNQREILSGLHLPVRNPVRLVGDIVLVDLRGRLYGIRCNGLLQLRLLLLLHPEEVGASSHSQQADSGHDSGDYFLFLIHNCHNS